MKQLKKFILGESRIPTELIVIQDTYVYQSNPTDNYSTSNRILTRLSGSAKGYGYLVFEIDDFSEFVYLSIKKTLSHTSALEIHTVNDNNVDINNITWNTNPLVSTGVIYSETNSWVGYQVYNFDLSTFLSGFTGNRLILMLTTNLNAGVTWVSKDDVTQNRYEPRLIKT